MTSPEDKNSDSFRVDESRIAETIRHEYDQLAQAIEITESWTTPAGNPRKTPAYEVNLRSSSYLNKTRSIKKTNSEEVRNIIRTQMSTWIEQEIRKRVAEENRHLQKMAESHALQLNQSAKHQHDALGALLKEGLAADYSLDWSRYLDLQPFHEFVFEDQPIQPSSPVRPRHPRRTFVQWVLPFLWKKECSRHQRSLGRWQARCSKHIHEWQATTVDWERRKSVALERCKEERSKHLAKQKKHNDSVAIYKERVHHGEPEVVEWYIREIVAAVSFPSDLTISSECAWDQGAKTVVLDLDLPNREDVTDVVGYSFLKTKREANPIRMKVKEHEAFYDDIMRQVVLLTFHAVFQGVHPQLIVQVVVNGWVTYVDPATGHQKTSCIISVSTTKDQFDGINLAAVDANSCIGALKGIVAGPLSQVAPVAPILRLNREDSRFVESDDVLAEINAATNLAELGWEEFEHLVRELFQAKFSADGAEVKVTQASSDGGVDAIAMDPDPIRGGKFVIQAKRYTSVVPVSATRELYGTMMAEGAVRGILVTTSHYGADSREFAKDKNITLIDGANLVHMLEEIGHKVRIDVKAAKAKKGWNPLKR